MNIGKRIKELRNARNLTQKQLAELSEISVNIISNYETGKKRSGYTILIAIAKFFDVSTDYLLGLEN